MDDPLCLVEMGGAIAAGIGYVYVEVGSWRTLNGVLDEFSKDLDVYIKENEFSRKKSYETDCELRTKLEGAIEGMDGLWCMPYTFNKRTRVRKYLNEFLDEDHKVEMKDAQIISRELKLAIKGESEAIRRQSTGGL